MTVDRVDEEELGPKIEPAEMRRLNALLARLEHERPLPNPGFRGQLKRDLAISEAAASDLPLMRRLALSCGSLGTALLVLAAVGIVGVGPLAP